MPKFPTDIPLNTESDAPGQLLAELEARQDAALADLEKLDRQLIDVLKGLGVTPEEDAVEEPPKRIAA